MFAHLLLMKIPSRLLHLHRGNLKMGCISKAAGGIGAVISDACHWQETSPGICNHAPTRYFVMRYHFQNVWILKRLYGFYDSPGIELDVVKT